jgi:hypothetical protein
MLEDLVLDAYAEVSGNDRKEIAIELILALIGLGIEAIGFYLDHCKQTKQEILRRAKYPTLETRLRFKRFMIHKGYKGDMHLAESVLFNVMKKADIGDILKELEEPKWVF